MKSRILTFAVFAFAGGSSFAVDLGIVPSVTESYQAISAPTTLKGNWWYQGYAQFDGQNRPISVGSTSPFGFVANKFKATDGVVLAFSGCLPSTQVSYHFAGLVEPSTTFAGDHNVSNPVAAWQLAFMTRWEAPGQLFLFRNKSGVVEYIPITGASLPSLTVNGFCADYRVVKNNGKVRATINGVQVYSGDVMGDPASPVTAYFQFYDHPLTMSKINLSIGLE
jgi:hypothetical protein